MSADTSRADGALEFPTRLGKARVVGRLDAADAALWERAFTAHAKDHRYHRICAETLAGQFDHRYLFLENAARAK